MSAEGRSTITEVRSGRSLGNTPARAREDLPEPEGPTIAVQRSPATIRATASDSARRPRKTAASASSRTLREAGLVRSTRDGKLVRHRLATDVIQRLGHDVLATVAR